MDPYVTIDDHRCAYIAGDYVSDRDLISSVFDFAAGYKNRRQVVNDVTDLFRNVKFKILRETEKGPSVFRVSELKYTDEKIAKFHSGKARSNDERSDFFWAEAALFPIVGEAKNDMLAAMIVFGEVVIANSRTNYSWVGFDIWDFEWLEMKLGEGVMWCPLNLYSSEEGILIPFSWTVLDKVKAGWEPIAEAATNADDFDIWFRDFVGADVLNVLVRDT